MKTKILLCGLILFVVHFSLAQVVLRIGQSTDNTFTLGQTAKIVYSSPSATTATDSWLIQGYVDGGYAFNVSKRNTLGLTLNSELHRNSLIEKKQDVWQYGFLADHNLQWLDNNNDVKSRLNTTLSIKHSDDRIKANESMHYLLGFTYYAANDASKANWGAKLITPDLYAPVGKSLGLVINHNLSAVVMNQQSDYLSLAQAHLGADAFLFHHFFSEKINNPRTLFLSANWNGRYALQDEVHNDMQPLRKLGAGLDISLLSLINSISPFAKSVDNRLMVKYEWVRGADPLKGLANQSYRLLTLNLVINI